MSKLKILTPDHLSFFKEDLSRFGFDDKLSKVEFKGQDSHIYLQPNSDLTICIGDEKSLGFLLEQNKHALLNKTEVFLPVSISEYRITAGPFVLLGEGPCFQCLITRIELNKPISLSGVIKQDPASNLDDRLRNKAIRPIVCSMICEEIIAAQCSLGRDHLRGFVKEHNLMIYRQARISIARHPRCPACSRQSQRFRSIGPLKI